MANDPLGPYRKQLEQFRKLTESPLVEMARKQQERWQEQQEQLRKLAESPLEAWLRANEGLIADFVSGPAMDSVIQFQKDLADGVIDYASPEITEDDPPLSDAELAEQAELFRYRALQFLIW